MPHTGVRMRHDAHGYWIEEVGVHASLDTEYLTVDETAKKLKVSTSTIWRWINQGQLIAYRVGPRKVRLKSEDVLRLVTPARGGGMASATPELERELERLSRPMTEGERRRALAALEAIEHLERERPALSKRSDLDSVELLRESREERTRQLS